MQESNMSASNKLVEMTALALVETCKQLEYDYD